MLAMRRGALVGAAIVLLVTAIAAVSAAAGVGDPGSRYRPAKIGKLGVVATESPAAARVGRAVLERGGNAVDAAAATIFAMGVARPQSCGIGGGGFLVYRSRTGRARALDFRETAGAAMRPTTLSGPGLHRQFTGHLTVGVPGTVAGMAAALDRYGTMSFAEALAPGERLARAGFRVPSSLSAAVAANAERLKLFPAAAAQYLRPDGTAPAKGSVLRQPALAESYRRLMRGGPDAFYRGTIARRIVRDMRAPRPETKDPGLLTLKDFAAYRAVWRDPIRSSYRGRLVIGVPPPSSGGIAIAEMLNILSAWDVTKLGNGSADMLHVVAEAQKIAFADRGAYVADPDVVGVPTNRLISAVYAGARSRDIDLARAGTYQPGLGPADTEAPGRYTEAPARAEESTTHVSVLDRDGNAVAVTCTIEQEAGSAVIAPGTGFLLNNELTDFGAPGTANEAAPRKRPRSSIAPTIVVEPTGRPRLVIGGAGGARIIMGVLQPILQTIDFDRTVDGALDAPRIDATNGTDGRVVVEDARLAPEVLAELERRGHRLQREGEYSARPRVNAVGMTPGGPGLDPALTDKPAAAADPRTDDGALAQRAAPNAQRAPSAPR